VVVIRNTIAFSTEESSSLSSHIPCSHKRRKSHRYNCSIKNETNDIPKHAYPDAKGGNPTAGLSLFWTRNPFVLYFSHRQISQEKARRIFKGRHEY
jgi:hypothetical protein